MANLYTKTGDKGTTGLYGGSRVPKDDPRVKCYGAIDEATSMLGLALALSDNAYVRGCIEAIQEKLFYLSAELASDEKGVAMLGDKKLGEADITALEQIADACSEKTGKMTCIVTPGVNRPSAALHVARTIVRRAEREMITAKRDYPLRDEIMRYVNRLSDTIYALARLEETEVATNDLRKEIEQIILAVDAAIRSQDGKGIELAECCCAEGKKCRPDDMSLATLKQAVLAAEMKAVEIRVPMVIAVTDCGGNLLILHRMDNALPGSVDIAINKAFTANAFKTRTEELGKHAQPGGPLYGIENSNGGRVVLFGGGIPLVVDGKVVGGFGVSGGTVEEDMCVAEAGVLRFTRFAQHRRGEI
ncbi:MAG: cob(I)yrinic acid a,c-diamide adenosyltransferase [Lachnospiraceae bacterium]|nr:cob(I)yrinic acid a,c-diamide adenosyltransferase [Lachnospiraceae bacterium]